MSNRPDSDRTGADLSQFNVVAGDETAGVVCGRCYTALGESFYQLGPLSALVDLANGHACPVTSDRTPAAGLVTYTEAAELVGVEPGTVRWWKHKGWLVEFSAGLFHTDDVYRCERQRRAAATVPLQRNTVPASELTDGCPRVQHKD